MKYNIIASNPPSTFTFEPMLTTADMMKCVVEKKAITFDVSEHTKTTLSVSVTAGKANFLVAQIPRGCEGLKFLKQERWGVWNGVPYVANYFKILKSQGWKEFKHYLTKILDDLDIQGWANHFGAETIDELDVTVWVSRSVRMRLGEPVIMNNLTLGALQ